jgi:hypothetical protein
MKLLNNFSIRNKLVLLLILPLAGLLYFQQKSISTEFDQKHDNRQRLRDIEKIELLSALINELQSESTLAQVYLSTNQQSVKDELIIQRAQTDKALDVLRKAYRENGTIERIEALGDVSTIRASIQDFPQHAHEINLNLLNQTSRKPGML